MTIVSDGDKFSVYKMKQGQVGSITDMGAMRRYWYAETRFKPKFTGSLSEALEYIEKQGAEYMETEVFKTNPRPRKYASASERQAAYRARAPEVCFRAEDKTVDTLDRIAADLDVSRADLLLSMTKFALTNHDWARFGLTHKPLPFGYGTQDETRKDNPVKSVTLDKAKGPNGYFYRLEKRGKGYDVLINSTGYAWRYLEKGVSEQKARDRFYLETMKRKENPTMKTTTKRKPTPAQLAARERFAEMARSGAFKKAGAKRKANPVRGNPSSLGTAPLKKVRSVMARSKTTGERRTFMMADSSGVKVPTPYDFGFRLEIEGETFDFVARYEGPLLIISEKSTGLRLPGDVGFTLRSSYGDDKNAAKRWTLDLIERVTPQKFAQKVRAAR
jgi:hypothetical protein